MIQVQYMKPFYSKVTGKTLRLVFAHQYFTIVKDEELFHFIPIEGKEMLINLDTGQVENLSDIFVFQRGSQFIHLPLYQMLLISNINEFLNPIIQSNYNGSTEITNSTPQNTKIAKICFYGLNGSTAMKTYYFNTDIENLRQGEIVIVDSRGEEQKGRFEGYYKGTKYQPTKWILRREGESIEQSKELTRERIEFPKNLKLSKQTEIMISEIMKFHKDNLIDKYLDDENYEALSELVNG